MASGEAYANQAGTVTDLAYVYVEDSSGGFKRMTKAQFISLMGGGSGYTLPAATETALGGIKAAEKGSGDTVAAKIGTDGKMYVPTYPTALKNPKKLTFSGGVTAEYDGSGAVTVTIPDGNTERITKDSADTVVSLVPNKLYVFPEMVTLSVTLSAPEDTAVMVEYHFIFSSGATATTLTIPDTVKVPSGFTVDANKIYEISIMENCLTYQSWEITA